METSTAQKDLPENTYGVDGIMIGRAAIGRLGFSIK